MSWTVVQPKTRTARKFSTHTKTDVSIQVPSHTTFRKNPAAFRRLNHQLLQLATGCSTEEILGLTHKHYLIYMKDYYHQPLSQSENEFLNWIQDCYKQIYKKFSMKLLNKLAKTEFERLQIFTDDGHRYEQRRLAKNEKSNVEFDKYAKRDFDMKKKCCEKRLRKKSDRRMAVILQKSPRRAKVTHKKRGRGATSHYKTCRKAMVASKH